MCCVDASVKSVCRSRLCVCVHLHLGGLLPSADGVVLKAELVLADDGPAVLVPHVGDHVHVGGPHLKLTLPVYDGGQGGAHQEWTLRVTLQCVCVCVCVCDSCVCVCVC